MAFLLHFLRDDDIFFDVGANIGSYTVLASKHVGCTTWAFEPSTKVYKYLMQNVELNDISAKVHAENIGLGAIEGSLYVTEGLDTVNHILHTEQANSHKVVIKPLDSFISEATTPILLKVDVEGYETNVIAGAHACLSSNELKAIIIELNGSGEKYGHRDADIHDNLIKYGFKACRYNGLTRKIIPADVIGTENTIYLRDIDFVQHRIETAEKVKLKGVEF